MLQKLPYAKSYLRIPIGDIELKGKESKVTLCALKVIETV